MTGPTVPPGLTIPSGSTSSGPAAPPGSTSSGPAASPGHSALPGHEADTAGGWAGVPVLVTGATGFIGAHLVDRLAALGARVHAVSRRPPQDRSTATWHAADLRDAEATTGLVRQARPEVVFHLASAVTGTRDVAAVRPTIEANLLSVTNLLTAAPEARTVLAGSIEEPRPEKGETTPSSPYAMAKWAATGYARLFHRLWEVSAVVLRVAMVYGPRDPNTARLVPYVTDRLLRGRTPELSSGTRLVDWIYVDDVVDAFLAAGRTRAGGGDAFDVGTGTALSIRDTVDLIARIVGGDAAPRYGALPDRPLDSARIADVSGAAEVLGWRPVTGIEDGLRRTVAWHAERL